MLQLAAKGFVLQPAQIASAPTLGAVRFGQQLGPVGLQKAEVGSLRYVQREHMTNATLRQRFGIDTKNSAIASRLLKEALTARVIRLEDEGAAPKLRRYVPHWA